MLHPLQPHSRIQLGLLSTNYVAYTYAFQNKKSPFLSSLCNKAANEWACSVVEPFHGSLGRENTLTYMRISRALIITDHLINSVEAHSHKVPNLLFCCDQGATVRRCAAEHNQSLAQLQELHFHTQQ